MTAFVSNHTYPVNVSFEFIKSLDFYKKEREFNDSHTATYKTLFWLGMNTKNVSTTQGLVRCKNDKTKAFFTTIFTGMTRRNFEHKHMYEQISVLVPDDISKDKLVDVSDLGEKYYEDILTIEQLEELQERDANKTRSRKVRLPKFKVEPVDEYMRSDG